MKKILIVVVLLLIVSFLFYWLQIRPSEIRKSCDAYVGSKIDLTHSYYQKKANNMYRQCLIQNGIPPESIFVNTE